MEQRDGQRGMPARTAVRMGGALLAAAYIAVDLVQPDKYRLLDHLDLAIHEAGHVVFSFFGEFIAVAGGTLLQLIVPAVFVAYFARQEQRYAAAITLMWVAQSLLNVSVYAADARAQLLPLVGGEYVIHDWAWMLSRLHLLQEDQLIGDVLRLLAFLVLATATLLALQFARSSDPAPELAQEDTRLRAHLELQ